MYPYTDLEHILFRCFLTEPFYVHETPVLLKSLTEHEFDYINDTYFFIKDDEEKFMYYIAFSILQVEGRNVLNNREELLDDLLEIVLEWPPEVIEPITQIMVDFRERTEIALSLLEPYCFTDNSRMKWMCYKNKLLNDPQISGWKGTEYFSLSSTQQSWITINAVEDARVRYENMNDVGRFVGSVYNPKGMKPLNDEENSRRKQELQRRQKLVEMVNEKYADRPMEKDGLKQDLQMLSQEERKKMSETALVDELNALMRGEKDDHEKLVEEYERAVKRMYLEEKKRKEELVVEKVQGKSLQQNPMMAVSRILSEEEVEKSQEEMRREYRERVQAAHPESNSAYRNMHKHIHKLSSLSDDEEEYLQKDVIGEIMDNLPKPDNVNNLINSRGIERRQIIAPDFNHFKKQSE